MHIVGSTILLGLVAAGVVASPMEKRGSPSWSLAFFGDTACATSFPTTNITLSGTTYQKCTNIAAGAGSVFVNDTTSSKSIQGYWGIGLYTGYGCTGSLYTPLQSRGTNEGSYYTLCHAEAVKSFLVAKVESG